MATFRSIKRIVLCREILFRAFLAHLLVQLVSVNFVEIYRFHAVKRAANTNFNEEKQRAMIFSVSHTGLCTKYFVDNLRFRQIAFFVCQKQTKKCTLFNGQMLSYFFPVKYFFFESQHYILYIFYEFFEWPKLPHRITALNFMRIGSLAAGNNNRTTKNLLSYFSSCIFHEMEKNSQTQQQTFRVRFGSQTVKHTTNDEVNHSNHRRIV